jgi:16S rRNA processing protein RimM
MDYITIGMVANTHGIHGEVKIFPTTDDITRFDLVKRVHVSNNGKEWILAVKGVKYFKHMVILKFAEIESMNEALLLKGGSVQIPMEEALPLSENENYIFELIGLVAREEDGNVLGKLKEVISTGAHDVYVIDDGSKNGLMIPARPAFILEVNVKEGYLIVKLIEGLKGL